MCGCVSGRCSRASAGSTWALSGLEWRYYGRWKSMSGADESLPNTSPTLFDTAMYERAMAKLWPTPAASDLGRTAFNAQNRVRQGHQQDLSTVIALNPSISSAAASPANPSPTLAGDWVPPTNAGSGRSSCESYARLGPDGCWLRMYQDSCQLKMDGSLEECSGTWPRAGTMRNGIVYRRQPLVPRISAIGSLYWPTPVQDGDRTTDYKQGGHSLGAHVRRWPTPQAYSHGPNSNPPGITKLDIEVRGMYPTPLPSDVTGGRTTKGKDRQDETGLRQAVGGQLNPTWVEWLMGFPLGWTDLEDSEML